MPAIVVIHRLKDFDAWYTQFKANPPPKIGRWRVLRASPDRNRVHVVGEFTDAEAKGVKEFIDSTHMQDVFRNVNAMSTAPVEIVWLEELKP